MVHVEPLSHCRLGRVMDPLEGWAMFPCVHRGAAHGGTTAIIRVPFQARYKRWDRPSARPHSSRVGRVRAAIPSTVSVAGTATWAPSPRCLPRAPEPLSCWWERWSGRGQAGRVAAVRGRCQSDTHGSPKLPTAWGAVACWSIHEYR